MNERCDDGREHSGESEYDADGIHSDGTPEVEHDYAIAAFADRKDLDQAREIVRHKRHIGGFESHVGALAHCDADRCFG